MIVKTIIADKEIIFLDGLESLLTSGEQYFYRIVGRCHSSADLINKVQETEANLIITDINLGDNQSSDFLKDIKKNNPHISICVLSTYTADKFVRKAFVNGVDGFVSKYLDFKELLRALATISNGRTFMSSGLQMTPTIKQSTAPNKVNSKTPFLDEYQLIERLTPREMEVLQLISQAKSNVEIGKELFISDQTVGVHRKNIMRKLAVRNTNGLIKFAYDNGLI